MILLIDNYDSFVFNLARYFQRLDQTTCVVRNDQLDVAFVQRVDPQAIVLSPGPCGPPEAGQSLDIVRAFWRHKPILGICLGHQIIAAAFGARIVRAPQPMHGRTSDVFHDSKGIFQALASPFLAGRYHSLMVDESTLPPNLEVSARTADGIIMAIRHRHRPVIGIQFHPESILTEGGYHLLANYLRMACVACPTAVPAIDSELRQPSPPNRCWPDQPITF